MSQMKMLIASMMNDYGDAADEDDDAADADDETVDEDDDAVDADDVLTQGRQPPLPRLLVRGLLLPGEATAPDESPSESRIFLVLWLLLWQRGGAASA